MKRAIIVQGLGFGDEGKGATVAALTEHFNAEFVIRFCGGCQAGHNWQGPKGDRHTFSQFGAGTMAGAKTYLAENFLLDIPALFRESAHLEELGIVDPLSNLWIHPNALLVTPYHVLLNQALEESRGSARHGSCGRGIGATMEYAEGIHFRDALRVGHLARRSIVKELLQLLWYWARERVFNVCGPQSKYFHALRDLDPSLMAESLIESRGRLQINQYMQDCETVIFEGSQGVLLDEKYGLAPHTTWGNVMPNTAQKLAVANGAEDICCLGVSRTYATRHGAGPFNSQGGSSLVDAVDVGNPENPWQGKLRVGAFNMAQFNYALVACEHSGCQIDGTVFNHLDQVGPIIPYLNLETPVIVPSMFDTLGISWVSDVFHKSEYIGAMHIGELVNLEKPAIIYSHGPTSADRTFLRDLPFRKVHHAVAVKTE